MTQLEELNAKATNKQIFNLRFLANSYTKNNENNYKDNIAKFTEKCRSNLTAHGDEYIVCISIFSHLKFENTEDENAWVESKIIDPEMTAVKF